MKLYNFLIIGCLALATASNNATASDATSSSDPLSDFAAAEFKIRPLKGVTGNTDFLSTETVAEL